jgi:mannose-1-phosphate guanylyltransferase
MSRIAEPKQLIPFVGGRSLLQLAFDRLDGLVPPSNRYVCAGRQYAEAVRAALPGLPADHFLGEPVARDTLNAVGFSSTVISSGDPDAVIAVFTADHVIEPVERFQEAVTHGYELAESQANLLVTFGITPTAPSTAYGYLQLGGLIDHSARLVELFAEKPEADRARAYLRAGPQRYLWNSGMFVWRASTLLECIRRYEPDTIAGLSRIGQCWDRPNREAVLDEVFPALKKISVDYAVMEPASRDPEMSVAAVPMPLRWIDVGSWPMFAEICPKDAQGNALGTERAVLVDTRGTLVASSDPQHLVAAVGCEDLIIIHTRDATLVCRKDDAEAIKEVHKLVGERFGQSLL